MAKRLAIVTQDPANRGGVLRLVEYIHARALSLGIEPLVLHYGKFETHPELSASAANLLRGELNLTAQSKRYEYGQMKAVAIGAVLPEWEPNRLRANACWSECLQKFDGYFAVTGSAHTAAPLYDSAKSFAMWVSSTIDDDRRERLRKSNGVSAMLERASLSAVKKVERHVLRDSERVLVVSHDTASHVQPLSTTEVEVCPFPVDTTLFSPGTTASFKPRFVFVGRANDPRKRINLFLDACTRLKQLDRSLTFSIDIVSEVAPVVTDAELPVRIHSRIDQPSLIQLYRGATALVLTSEQEGLGIAAMEAMACGTPVISTRSGGPETFIHDRVSGFFCEGADEIARAMLALATDSTHRTSLGDAARARIEQDFSEAVWNDLFDEVLLERVNG